MPRLFTALEIPAAIGEQLALLRGGLPGARWVEPANYHVTLRFIGDVDGATVVKLRRSEPKVSYLSYPDFDADPHPALAASVNVDLRTFRVRSRSWSAVANPPVLHRKEDFVPTDHPDWRKFSRLTKRLAALA